MRAPVGPEVDGPRTLPRAELMAPPRRALERRPGQLVLAMKPAARTCGRVPDLIWTAAGERDDRRLRRDPLGDVEAAHVGEADVEQHDLGREARDVVSAPAPSPARRRRRSATRAAHAPRPGTGVVIERSTGAHSSIIPPRARPASEKPRDQRPRIAPMCRGRPRPSVRAGAQAFAPGSGDHDTEVSDMQARQLPRSAAAAVILIAVGSGQRRTPRAPATAPLDKAFYVDHSRVSSSAPSSSYRGAVPDRLRRRFAPTLVDASPQALALGQRPLRGATVASAGSCSRPSCSSLSPTRRSTSGSAVQALTRSLPRPGRPSRAVSASCCSARPRHDPAPQRPPLARLAALVLGVVIFTPIGFAGFAGFGPLDRAASVALTMQLRSPKATLGRPVATS